MPRARVALFFRCECGKWYTTVGVGPASVCACGLELYWQAYPRTNLSTPVRDVKVEGDKL